MLSRKLFSVFTAAAIAGGILAAPAISTPLAHATEATVVQTPREATDPYPFSYSPYILQGGTKTFTPLRDDLPAGTTLTLDQGPALEALRTDGWVISATDSVLTVTAPRHAEDLYQIPVLITHPDQSTEAFSLEIFVDYLEPIPLSIQVPVFSYLHLKHSSTSSTSSI